jgi:hypothetical protein
LSTDQVAIPEIGIETSPKSFNLLPVLKVPATDEETETRGASAGTIDTYTVALFDLIPALSDTVTVNIDDPLADTNGSAAIFNTGFELFPIILNPHLEENTGST